MRINLPNICLIFISLCSICASVFADDNNGVKLTVEHRNALETDYTMTNEADYPVHVDFLFNGKEGMRELRPGQSDIIPYLKVTGHGDGSFRITRVQSLSEYMKRFH
jgi:hypothetical protein